LCVIASDRACWNAIRRAPILRLFRERLKPGIFSPSPRGTPLTLCAAASRTRLSSSGCPRLAGKESGKARVLV